jgi:hypothetical protein
MADQKRDVVKFMTPAVAAIYPRLNEPDTKYKKEGEYSVKLPFADGQFPADLMSSLEEMLERKKDETLASLKEKKQGAKIKSLKTRSILTAETDKETGEETGRFTINAKMRASGISKKTGKAWTRSPKIFDAKGTDLKSPPSIWGGSVLKVAGEAMAYYTPKDNEIGVAFYLEAVQIIKLVSGKAREAGDYGFGEEADGYTADTSTFSDETANADTAGGDSTATSGEEF